MINSHLVLGLAATTAAVLVVADMGSHGKVRRSIASYTHQLSGERLPAKIDSVLGVFEGRTPCGAIASGFTGFGGPNCEKIKWRLTLYRDSATGNPTTFLFEGTRTTRQGRWRIDRSSGAALGRVFRLYYGRPERVLSLLSVEDNVLLLLGNDLKALVGDASWSYVLNRVNR